MAENVRPGIVFRGISFESERPELTDQLPLGGRDIQDEPLLWVLPDKTSTWMSLRELAEAQEDELCGANAEEAYKAVGEELQWDVLATPVVEGDFVAFREDPGTLVDERWKQLEWTSPEDETAPCWWLINAADEQTRPPILVSRSLACMRLEINQHRLATTSKLRHEWDKRTEHNFLAVQVLENNEHLWKHARGPLPEDLFDPSDSNLESARCAADTLQRMLDSGGNERDGLAQFGEEIISAVGTIKSLRWEMIRRERFSITPLAVFDAVVRNAEALIGRRDAEAQRRRDRLAVPVESRPDDENEAMPKPTGRVDRFGLNIDEEFNTSAGNKPVQWAEAVKLASEVCLDEMKTLLELHYDTIWRKRIKKDNEFEVFASAAKAYQRRLNVRLVLPQSLKDVLRSPVDERRLEGFRQVLRRVV